MSYTRHICRDSHRNHGFVFYPSNRTIDSIRCKVKTAHFFSNLPLRRERLALSRYGERIGKTRAFTDLCFSIVPTKPSIALVCNCSNGGNRANSRSLHITYDFPSFGNILLKLYRTEHPFCRINLILRWHCRSITQICAVAYFVLAIIPTEPCVTTVYRCSYRNFYTILDKNF